MIGKRVIKVVCANNKGWWHKPAIWGIQQAENVDFNHVAFLTEFNIVYEAVFPEARSMRLNKWLEKFEIVRTFEVCLDADLYNSLIGKVISQLGTRYSVWQCIMIWVAQNNKIIQRQIENTTWNGHRAMICSEFVGRPLAELGIVQFDQGLDSVGMDEIEIALRQIAFKIY